MSNVFCRYTIVRYVSEHRAVEVFAATSAGQLMHMLSWLRTGKYAVVSDWGRHTIMPKFEVK